MASPRSTSRTGIRSGARAGAPLSGALETDERGEDIDRDFDCNGDFDCNDDIRPAMRQWTRSWGCARCSPPPGSGGVEGIGMEWRLEHVPDLSAESRLAQGQSHSAIHFGPTCDIALSFVRRFSDPGLTTCDCIGISSSAMRLWHRLAGTA